jgi:Domain of unknown function (DUF222)
MFEVIEPPDDWAALVPVVPPFDPADCAVEELAGWPGPDDGGYGEADGDGAGCDDVLPDPVLVAAGWDALVELEQDLEQARLDGLDADATLVEAAGNRQAERRSQARRLWLAAHWADLHAVLPRPGLTRPGAERLVRLGGDGTPQLAEFAPAELGAVLGISDHAASTLVADALDLRHRLPTLWQLVQAGFVDGWLARQTADRTRQLTLQAARRVDARIARLVGTLTWRRLKTILDAAIMAADPPQALSDAERAAAEAGVWLVDEPQDGYQTMLIKAAAGDLHAFDQALDLIAGAMKTLGHPGTLEQRRAAAVGILANPQAAQHLIAKAEAVRKAQIEAAAARHNGDPATADRRPFAFHTAVLYYHLSQHTLDAILNRQEHAGAGVVRVEDIGPVIADQVKQWLGHSNVVLKPVIDLAGIPPADHYEITPAMSEAIGLIRSADYWPYGNSLSRHQDNDHTTPYLPMNQGGPPGQTDPRKMGKLTRTHHRIKTFAGWKVTQLRPGGWLYRSPHHQYYLVDQHGTTPLGKL